MTEVPSSNQRAQGSERLIVISLYFTPTFFKTWIPCYSVDYVNDLAETVYSNCEGDGIICFSE